LAPHVACLPALQHRHEPHNNWDTEFDFTDANYERVGAAVHLNACRYAQRSSSAMHLSILS
jgi:hypothetical protein